MNLNHNRDHTGELDIKRLGSVLMQIIVSMELIWNVNISWSDEKCFNFLNWNKSCEVGLICIIGVLSDLICFLFISDRFPVPAPHLSPLSIWVCQPALCQWRSGQHPPLPSCHNYALHLTPHTPDLLPPPWTSSFFYVLRLYVAGSREQRYCRTVESLQRRSQSGMVQEV